MLTNQPMDDSPEITEKAFRAWVRTHGMFRQLMEEYFQRQGLSGAQWGVLRTLRRAEDEGVRGLSPGELSRRMIVKAPSVTGVIDRLERQGLVERIASRKDLRSKEIHLTKEGRALLERALKKHPAQMEKILGGLTVAQRAELLKLLKTD